MTSRSSALAAAISANTTVRHDDNMPLWKGPCAPGPLGGITQSMIVRFLSCRERFRLKYIYGLEPHDKWTKTIGYGNMWHVCEEALASERNHFGEVVGTTLWEDNLLRYTQEQYARYPFQRDEIEKWWRVCRVQFPEYIKHWSKHPDVKNRSPLLQEYAFDVLYKLPSGRLVRLRGKYDSVDLIDEADGGVYLQENKTKGDIDELDVERQLKFDLQTMLYLTSLYKTGAMYGQFNDWVYQKSYPIRGVRYNVVRRPLSGGKGSIKPHEGKCTKPVYSKRKGQEHVILHESKITPAETADEFYERLRRDYIADDPGYWFFRVRAEISMEDIRIFRETCLDPILEQLCWWYDEITGKDMTSVVHDYGYPPMSYRTPFGVWSALEEGGATEYDTYLATGNEAGLCRTDKLFTELQ